MKRKPSNFSFYNFLLNLKTMFIVGSLVHISAAFCVYLIGRFAIFPNWIFSKGTMREDSFRYLEKSELLSQALSNGKYDFLITTSEQVHIRFYALSHYLLSDVLGSNILVFEIINLPLFLLIILLTYKIGEMLFEPKVGFFSAYLVMLLPSFLLHTTQPLRDSLFIAVLLLLLFQFLRLLNKSFNIQQSLIWIISGVLTFLLLWFIRDSMLSVYVGIILVTLVLTVGINLQHKWKYKYNLVPILFFLLFAVLTPKFFSAYLPEKRDAQIADTNEVERFIKGESDLQKSAYLIKVNTIRFRFSIDYKDAGSNIDAGYIFEDTQSLIRYLPKALAVGLFSPFPKTWLGEGVEYGRAGRILSGIETALIYLFILFAISACWKEWNVSIFFIISTILISTTALGLVLINTGALYRLRYAFWFLIIILGTKGAFNLIELTSNRRKSVEV